MTITYENGEVSGKSVDNVVIVGRPKVIAIPELIPESSKYNLSEEKVIQILLQDEEIRNLAEQRELLILMFTRQEVLEVKYYT